MGQHHKAKLGPAGRAQLVSVINAGASFRTAATAMNVAPATAHRWWWRWQQATETERCSGVWSQDRSSRPHRCPAHTSEELERRVCDARRRTDLGPGRLAGIVGCPRSTVHAVLKRHQISRRRRAERQTFTRYEWSQPGALLHMDVNRLARFHRPGHRVTGRGSEHESPGAGWVYLHVVIDDHSRYLYVEQHDHEDAETNAGTVQRAVAHFTELGLRTPEAVMTDTALVYIRSRRFAEVLALVGARHITTPRYTPRWNAKAERVIRTLQDEWAYAHAWDSSQQRTRALRSFIRYYNRRRPHSSLKDRPPISRVHDVPGQNS
ncbi:MAG: IS481 family transposase [Myxococcaceae bacterium]